jgi:hypothetical protein
VRALQEERRGPRKVTHPHGSTKTFEPAGAVMNLFKADRRVQRPRRPLAASIRSGCSWLRYDTPTPAAKRPDQSGDSAGAVSRIRRGCAGDQELRLRFHHPVVRVSGTGREDEPGHSGSRVRGRNQPRGPDSATENRGAGGNPGRYRAAWSAILGPALAGLVRPGPRGPHQRKKQRPPDGGLCVTGDAARAASQQ